MALPEFQRGYVWNREQVRGLMDSLYRKHPVGSLLVWVTKTDTAVTRGDGTLAPGSVKLLLDGQQRITSLYGIIRGRPPQFFDGNEQAFTGLHFHLAEESFEFYAPAKMKDNPLWVNVSELMEIGAGEAIQRVVANPDLQSNLTTYINRLNAIDAIKENDFHIEEVTGEDKTIDVMVDIFNRVNSGGTKLSKGDLALARVCAEWPDARSEMKTRLRKWKAADFDFKLEWLLRNINSIVTGEALFSALKDVDATAFKDGLQQAEKAIDKLLNLVSTRLGLDHNRVLGGRYAFPLMSRYVLQHDLSEATERDKLLYWYVHTFLWGRYSGSTETMLNQDLALIEEEDGALDRLINGLRRSRGDLQLRAEDYVGWSQGSRFYPLLYMLTRAWHAKDWDSGAELSSHLLGNLSRLELHHIFPKALLYRNGYDRPNVNALANFTFLTQETNLKISDREPAEYLEKIKDKQPGAIESHWIPMNESLWKVENYLEFLAARRQLLAEASNQFLDSLLAGDMREADVGLPIAERPDRVVPGDVEDEEEDRIIRECNEWVTAQGLPVGEYSYELTHEDTGEPLAIFDLAWPDGLQPGYSRPVALLINESQDLEEIANRAGYRYFTDVEEFHAYVEREILALA